MSRKYALIIGNSEYTDTGLAQLTAPGKDAEDFARVLGDKEICEFDEVKTLLNQSSHVVREAIDEFFHQKKPDDLIILYFSGHGVRDELGQLYLAVKNTNRFRLRSTAIRSDFIRESMDQSRSRRQVLILDCCNSGAFSQGTKAATGVSIGTSTAFESGYGRIILTASDSTQFAWEGDKVIGETDNSLFTHFLVQGLEGIADRDGDGKITVDELYDYAYEQVKLSTPKQTPSKFSNKQQGEIILRQNIRIEDTVPVPLPDDLIAAINSSMPFVREGAVRQLEEIMKGRNLGLIRSARLALEKMENEDDSRRVSQLSTKALETIRQQELDEKRIVTDLAKGIVRHTTRIAGNEINSLLKHRDKRLLKEKANTEEKLENTKVETSKKNKEEVKQFANQNKLRETKLLFLKYIKTNFNQLKLFFHKIISYIRNVLKKTATFFKSTSKNRSKIYIASTLIISLTAASFIFYSQDSNNVLYFSGRLGVEFYHYDGEQIDRVQNLGFGQKWLPVKSAFGELYFTSNRDGKAEIYQLTNDGSVIRITNTPGNGQSWSPTMDAFGHLYFASNREGKTEIYELKKNAEVVRVTHTPNSWESWSPTTTTFGRLFFTSNRSGKAEIYELLRSGDSKQYTKTPGEAESWSPVIIGSNIFFTSNRDNKKRVYKLNPLATAIVDFESWTTRKPEILPNPSP